VELLRKLTGRVRRDAIDAELQEEMQIHLDMKASATGDRHAALRDFGNPTLLLEDSREAWGWPRVEDWLRDFRYALRVLVRKPGFAVTVVLTLALGIGASSTIFSLIDTVLIRPLPYPHSDRLVAVSEAKPAEHGDRTPVSPGRLEDWQRLNGSFVALAGTNEDTVTDTTGSVPERISAVFVSPQFFSALGVSPALGRVFSADEERFGGPLAIIISDGLWRRRFGSDPAVLGQTLVLANQSHVIVGVMPGTFQYPSPTAEIWVPKKASPALLRIREARSFQAIGRLRDGVTLEQAQADLAAVQRRLGERYPKTDAGWGVVIAPLKEQLVGSVRLALWLLFGSVSLLLLISCTNVSCLLLARLSSRAAEIATRRALGAGRATIARQLFAEGLAYAFAGGLLGMAVAFAGIDFLRKEVLDIPRIAELAVDARTLGVLVGITVLTVILFSLAPLLQTFRRESTGVLMSGGRGVVGSRQRLTHVLVSAQLALATALLIGAGLSLRSLIRLEDTPLGFRSDAVLTFRIGGSINEPADAAVQRHQRTLSALSSIPGVTAVSMSSGLPGASTAWPREFEIPGEPAPDGTLRFTMWRIVTAGYFQTVGIPIVEGRTCYMNADPDKPFEVLVNRSFAARYFPGRDPIGRMIQGGAQGDTTSRIVGIVPDTREEGPAREPQPLIYACGFLRYWPDSNFLLQTSSPISLASSVREVLRNVEPNRPIYAVRPLDDALKSALAQNRFRTLLVSLFSVMALTLAAIGLYGVMAYMVAQRAREIGIRVALGARPVQIVRAVVCSGGLLAASGAAAGIVLAAAASRMLGTLLYGVRPWDLTSYLSATGVLLAVALFACLIPSRRAASIDPTQALREQ
jgi:predicted permease